MLFRSRLMQRFVISMLLIISMIFITVYFYSVPVIKKKVYEIELTSSRFVLDSVYTLANRMYFDTEKFRSQALESRKKQLRSVVQLAESYITSRFEEARQQGIAPEQIRQQVFEEIRSLKYGSNDYIWISDYNARLLSHPDPRYHQTDASRLRGNDGEASIPVMVRIALEQGEGFHQYKWYRLDDEQQQDKVSYIKSYPQWSFVIGTGVYLEDLQQESERLKWEALQQLREGLQDIKIASTGYLYVFDAKTNMLIHPNPNIDGTNFLNLANPVTGNPIAEDLIRVSDKDKPLYYKWDRPDDPGNYIYEKLSLVRYLPGFDWYIGSSVYVDELRSSAELLAGRIMTIAIIVLLIALLLMLMFSHWITRPVKQLADTAIKVKEGDLSAKSGINRDDEMGLLARTFDDMVDRLRDNIQNLDSKVAERTHALAGVEQRQRLILDALPARIVYLDNSLQVLFVNRSFKRTSLYPEDQLIHTPLDKLVPRDEFNEIRPQFTDALQGVTSDVETTQHQNGKEIIVRRRLIPAFDNDNQVNGVLLLEVDITAEKNAEKQLSEAQRMNAVGQMAGGLAHDFNNLLTIILGNLYSARDHGEPDDQISRYIEPAMRATRRGADITNRLLAFSRRQPLSPSLIDIDQVFGETLKLLSSSLPDSIDIRYHSDVMNTLPFVDPGRLEDALVNLAFNARDAMPEGGTLEFSVSPREIASLLMMDEPVAMGSYIEIRITDTGSGFSDEALLKAIEPFYTTKSGGAGSGLGLSMVYGFVKQSQGYINIDNLPGQGSEITLLLPASEAPAEPEAPASSVGPAGDNSDKLILLVEDDHDVRDVVRQQLTSLGYGVMDTHSADEAQRLIPLLPPLYGLVSDIMMPGQINGIQLADWLHQREPQCHIVLISGYAFQSSEENPINQDFTLLAKPFDTEALQRALQQSAQQIKQSD